MVRGPANQQFFKVKSGMVVHAQKLIHFFGIIALPKELLNDAV